MLKKIKIFIFFILVVGFFASSINQVVHSQVAVCNVKDYGAKGDGRADDTGAIQRAIDDCALKGGGKVEFFAGTFITGSGIHLKDNISLKLNNATIKGADDFYGKIIHADHVNNIGIEGPGIIDRGRGPLGAGLDPDEYWVHMVGLDWCVGVNLKNITIDSHLSDYEGLHGYHLQTSGCKNVTEDNVTINANIHTGANDSFHITNGGNNINIVNSNIVAGDDSIVFHGQDDFEDVTVQNVSIDGYEVSAAIVLTTFENSNTNLTFDNIRIHNALAGNNSWGGRGIAITPRGPNVKYNNIAFLNITMDGDIPQPIYGIYACSYAGSGDISGLSAKGITFKNIDIYRDKNAYRDDASKIEDMDDVVFENVTYHYPANQNIPNPLVYFRSIDGLTIKNFKIIKGGAEISNPTSYLRVEGSCKNVTIQSTPPATKKGDLNNDGKVDVIDLGILLSSWGRTDKPPADLNQDSKVDVVDLGILLSNWG